MYFIFTFTFMKSTMKYIYICISERISEMLVILHLRVEQIYCITVHMSFFEIGRKSIFFPIF